VRLYLVDERTHVAPRPKKKSWVCDTIQESQASIVGPFSKKKSTFKKKNKKTRTMSNTKLVGPSHATTNPPIP